MLGYGQTRRISRPDQDDVAPVLPVLAPPCLLKSALSENLTKGPYYAALPILRTARSSRLLTARRLALSSR